jgi:hypothetical protein
MLFLGRSHHDFGTAWFLWVARGMRLGDGVKDDLGRERSPLSELRVTNHLPLNLLPLPLQLAFCFLQLSDHLIDFCNRRGCDLLNERNDLRINFCLSRNLCITEIANFAFNRQICRRGWEFVISNFIHYSIYRGIHSLMGQEWASAL